MEKMYKRYPSFTSLRELSLGVLCDNIIVYIEPVGKNPAKKPARYRFRNPKVWLPNEISEDLLAKMIEKKLLCDATMFLFNSKNTMLKNVRLQNCEVGQVGLQVLKQHKITKLEYSNSAVNSPNISNILGNLNEWTLANMTDANFSNCTATNNYFTRNTWMGRIPHIKDLNLSSTNLDQKSLWIICSHLKLLEKLDISNTFVEDLRPLIGLADRLISLSIRDLFTARFYSYTIRRLNKLRYLDVSIYEKSLSVHPDDTSMSTIPLYDVLAGTRSQPELVFLDISGWRNFVPNTTIMNYVAAHPKLRYLGCVLNDISLDDSLQNVAPPGLVISGLSNEQQVKVALVIYRDKFKYAQIALWNLYQLAKEIPGPRPDLFDLVLSVMAAHPKQFSVQSNATDCLQILSGRRDEMIKNIHPQSRSVAVDLTLNAMECFPDRLELQRESMLVLGSALGVDHTSLEINFDHPRCAKLVLEALCKFENEDEEFIAMFICSVLADKGSTEETRKLGARPNYMRKLLAIIRNRVNSRVSDATLFLTLGILWDMTREIASCTVFLDQGGAELLLNVLETFKDDSVVEYRALGLLFSTDVEMKRRHSPMLDSLMDKTFVLLKSENFNVNLLASSIVGYYLAENGYDEWNLASHSRDEMLRELEDTVSQWRAPDGDNLMRAFPKDLRHLLSMVKKTDTDFQVQLWAVWAMHCFCTIYPGKFCPMLQDEKNHQFFRELIQSSESDPKIKMISTQLLEIVAQHAVR